MHKLLLELRAALLLGAELVAHLPQEAAREDLLQVHRLDPRVEVPRRHRPQVLNFFGRLVRLFLLELGDPRVRLLKDVEDGRVLIRRHLDLPPILEVLLQPGNVGLAIEQLRLERLDALLQTHHILLGRDVLEVAHRRLLLAELPLIVALLFAQPLDAAARALEVCREEAAPGLHLVPPLLLAILVRAADDLRLFALRLLLGLRAELREQLARDARAVRLDRVRQRGHRGPLRVSGRRERRRRRKRKMPVAIGALRAAAHLAHWRWKECRRQCERRRHLLALPLNGRGARPKFVPSVGAVAGGVGARPAAVVVWRCCCCAGDVPGRVLAVPGRVGRIGVVGCDEGRRTDAVPGRVGREEEGESVIWSEGATVLDPMKMERRGRAAVTAWFVTEV